MISRVMMNWLVHVYIQMGRGYLALPAGQTYRLYIPAWADTFPKYCHRGVMTSF